MTLKLAAFIEEHCPGVDWRERLREYAQAAAALCDREGRPYPPQLQEVLAQLEVAGE